ncbi:P-loop containing nucleoside triphosphate hydrolase protein, partial [Fistulina hepatica ATCC 64428]
LDDRMWVDKYEPSSEEELAVHERKVDDVRQWLNEAFHGGPSGKLHKYRRILVLTGPAGTGKTATLRVLSREMNFDITEWRNAPADDFIDQGHNWGDEGSSHDGASSYESAYAKFETFMARALSCQNVFASSSRRKIVLLEDLPNIIHAPTQAQFHATLQAFVTSTPSVYVPVVVIVSDAGLRGEAVDERLNRGAFGERDNVVDVRTIIPKSLLLGPYVQQVAFNPIAPTLMAKALQGLMSKQFARSSSLRPSKEFLDLVAETSSGDIRSAIMTLQFACVVDCPSASGRSRKKTKGSKSSTKVVLEAVTRREQTLALFHLVGKIMYNKRKGDPPSASAKVRDRRREQELDAGLVPSMPLPKILAHHERAPSRIDVDSLYADSPVDSSLLALYIHQNYPQFCNEMEHCENIIDWLSCIDSSGGEAWYQANPHRFHLLTLGTLHSLPSPVERRGQKIFKPEFFDIWTKEKDAHERVRDVRTWLVDQVGLIMAFIRTQLNVSQEKATPWSQTTVATQLGGILKAYDAKGYPGRPAPTTHRLFSRLLFTQNSSAQTQLAENDVEVQDVSMLDETVTGSGLTEQDEMNELTGGWLESDDIEDF